MLTAIIKSFDTVVINATTTNSITLSPTGIGLIVIPMSTGVACGLKVSKRVFYERVVQKHSNHKKNFKKPNKLLNLSIDFIEKIYKLI